MRVPAGLLTVFAALLPAAASADSFGSGANQFDIDFVTIGNPGNAPDDTGYGAVASTYRIGTYEVSRGMIGAYNAIGEGPTLSIGDDDRKDLAAVAQPEIKLTCQFAGG